LSDIEVAREGRVAVCTIATADGCMTADTVRELDACVAAAAADDEVGAVLLTGGTPGTFVRHYSVAELEALARKLKPRGLVADPERPLPERDIDRLFGRLEAMAKPAVAAINGTAMGGGFELCLACDIRIAEAGTYWLGLPEINIGLLPGAGGTQKLARIVGPARALELLLRGRTLQPVEALALGLVHEVAAAPVRARGLALAAELAAKPQPALGHIKRLLRGYVERPLAEGLAAERTLFLDTMLSDAAQERMGRLNAGEYDIRLERPARP